MCASTLSGLEQAALRNPVRHQPIVEIAQAYGDLQGDIRIQLDRAFAGDLDMHDIHALAANLVWRVEPPQLAFVIARLICMSNERPEVGGLTVCQDVDIEIPLPAGLVMPQEC